MNALARGGTADPSQPAAVRARLDVLKDQHPAEWDERSNESDAELGGLLLVGTFRSRVLSVTIEPKDWEVCEWGKTGATAVRLAVASAIGRQVGKKLTGLGPLFLKWKRGHEILPRDREPADGVELRQIKAEGFEFEATIGLRGGADAPDGGAAQAGAEARAGADGGHAADEEEIDFASFRTIRTISWIRRCRRLSPTRPPPHMGVRSPSLGSLWPRSAWTSGQQCLRSTRYQG